MGIQTNIHPCLPVCGVFVVAEAYVWVEFALLLLVQGIRYICTNMPKHSEMWIRIVIAFRIRIHNNDPDTDSQNHAKLASKSTKIPRIQNIFFLYFLVLGADPEPDPFFSSSTQIRSRIRIRIKLI